jgi:hypothetical protein
MRRLCADRGTGLIGSLAAVTVVLVLMFFAVQLLTSLYAASLVTSAAHEAVNLAAGRSVDQTDRVGVATARLRGERRARQLLGKFGDRVEMDWSGSNSDVVVLRVRAEPPRFLLGDLGIGLVDRTVRARVEALR